RRIRPPPISTLFPYTTLFRSRSPPDLPRMFHPIFAPELLENSQLLGLALTLQNPVKARLFLKVKSPESASELARNLHNEPQRWLDRKSTRLNSSHLVISYAVF